MIAIDLYTNCRKLDEISYTELQDKQDDIEQLFPIFPERVKGVGSSGGSHMADSKPPDTWHFRINSASIPGHKYDAHIKFKNIVDEIKAGVAEKDNWSKDGQHVDYRKLASDMLANVDVEVGCSCPADLYWGGKYIRTQRDANYGSPENRAPKKRNPREHGAYCKHLHLLLQTLPWYHGDMAKFLKDFYGKDITKLENAIKGVPDKEEEPKVEPKKEEPKKVKSKKEEPKRTKPKRTVTRVKAEPVAEPEPTDEPEAEPKKEEPKSELKGLKKLSDDPKKRVKGLKKLGQKGEEPVEPEEEK